MSAHRFSLARAALAAVFLASTGCSVVLKADAEQCETDADCAARGAEFAGTVCLERVCEAKVEVVDPKWGCLGNVAPLMGGSMVTVAVKLLDLVSSAPLKQVTARLCSKYDPLCSSPLGTSEIGALGAQSDVETKLGTRGVKAADIDAARSKMTTLALVTDVL